MAAKKSASSPSNDVVQQVRAFGLTYPGAHLKSPWPDHMDLAVKDKTFAYLPKDGEPFRIGVKLPVSNEKALMLPNAQPTGYGLGKSGWVDIQFAPGESPPLDLVREWLEESYRAQAPKSLVKELDAQRAGGGAPAAAPSTRAAASKPAPRKAAKAPVKKSAAKKSTAKKATRS